MTAVGIGVHPRLVTVTDRRSDFVADADAAKRQVARSDRLGKLHQIGLHAIVFEREQLAGPAEAGNDFIGHKQHFVLVTDFANTREVVIRRHDNATGALHRLGNEHGNRFGALAQDLLFQFVGRGNTLRATIFGPGSGKDRGREYG